MPSFNQELSTKKGQAHYYRMLEDNIGKYEQKKLAIMGGVAEEDTSQVNEENPDDLMF